MDYNIIPKRAIDGIKREQKACCEVINRIKNEMEDSAYTRQCVIELNCKLKGLKERERVYQSLLIGEEL